jgi:hypothetical protein
LPVTTVLRQGSVSGVFSGFLVWPPTFHVPGAGLLEVVVDWTSSDNNVDIALWSGSCIEDPPSFMRDCVLQAQVQGRGIKPKRIVARTGFASDVRLAVSNRGPGQEAFSYQVLFTP